MSQYRENKVTGTLVAGSSVVVELDPDYAFKRTTVSVSGNITGTITLTKKVVGATRYTAFETAATIDLTQFDEKIIEGMALAGLTLSHAGTGADMTITVVQSTDY